MEKGTNSTLNVLTEDPTQVTRMGPGAVYIVAAVFVALQIVVALSGNLIVIASFCTFRDLRTKCNFFIISLAISDILVALIAMPFWMLVQLSHNNWIYGKNLKMFWDCMDILCGTASITNLTAVSFDRQLAITSPFAYVKIQTTRRVIVIICFAWFYATAISSSRLLNWPFPSYLWFVSVVSFFLPLLIMLVMYGRIYLVARYQARRIGRNYATDIKAAKTIAVVIGGFVICWLPFFVVVLSVANSGRSNSVTFVNVANVAKWLEYLNSCLNPIIYTCSNRTYRNAFKRLFRRCRAKIMRNQRDPLRTGLSTWHTVAESHAMTHREASSDQSGLVTPNSKATQETNESMPLQDKHTDM